MRPKDDKHSEAASRNRNGQKKIHTGLGADAIAEALIENLRYLQAKPPLQAAGENVAPAS
jgi:hypothetical protein